MIKLLLSFYKVSVPIFIRRKISICLFSLNARLLRVQILSYFKRNVNLLYDLDIKSAVQYLQSNKISVFPNNFQNNYLNLDIDVISDLSTGLKFVIHNGKKLYFKRAWDEITIREYYRSLIIEQDSNSPHLYLTDSFSVDRGSVFVDIGAAEGIIALDVIDDASKVYLFEVNPDWIEALNATFYTWADKVVIINKYASNVDSLNSVSIDNYFTGRETPNFIKIDVDGAESLVLDGCKNILNSASNIKVVICTYHKQGDAALFSTHFTELGFSVEFSKGLMLFYCDTTKLIPPYFVKGVLRAFKN